MKYLTVAGRIALVGLFLAPFLPAYLAGAVWESVRRGWRSGRADIMNLDGQ